MSGDGQVLEGDEVERLTARAIAYHKGVCLAPSHAPRATPSRSHRRAVQVTSEPSAKKLRTVKAPVKASWKVDGSHFTLTKLVVAKPPKKARATLRCSGKKCPFKSKSTSKVRKGKINVLGVLGKKRAFRAEQTLELRVSAPGLNTKVLRFALKKGKQPKAVRYCLPLGKEKVQKRC